MKNFSPIEKIEVPGFVELKKKFPEIEFVNLEVEGLGILRDEIRNMEPPNSMCPIEEIEGYGDKKRRMIVKCLQEEINVRSNLADHLEKVVPWLDRLVKELNEPRPQLLADARQRLADAGFESFVNPQFVENQGGHVVPSPESTHLASEHEALLMRVLRCDPAVRKNLMQCSAAKEAFRDQDRHRRQNYQTLTQAKNQLEKIREEILAKS